MTYDEGGQSSLLGRFTRSLPAEGVDKALNGRLLLTVRCCRPHHIGLFMLASVKKRYAPTRM